MLVISIKVYYNPNAFAGKQSSALDLRGFARFFYPTLDPYPVKSKGSPYSITERRVPELIRNDQFSAEWDAKPQPNQSINR